MTLGEHVLAFILSIFNMLLMFFESSLYIGDVQEEKKMVERVLVESFIIFKALQAFSGPFVVIDAFYPLPDLTSRLIFFF